ncbi:hypothetical protein ACIBF5_11300 [Micromonospora sp. NPDC050417]|uniref:hypothetical protein n=1 Tax=Micromonospora sp. NPDC050417 TaxID=3364280 RepID=UPI0037BC9463
MPTAEELISTATVTGLVRVLTSAAPHRRWDAVAASATRLTDLALGERSLAVRDALLVDLPDSYALSAAIVDAALADPALPAGWSGR